MLHCHDLSVHSELFKLEKQTVSKNANGSMPKNCFSTRIKGSGRTNTEFPSDHELLNERRKDRDS